MHHWYERGARFGRSARREDYPLDPRQSHFEREATRSEARRRWEEMPPVRDADGLEDWTWFGAHDAGRHEPDRREREPWQSRERAHQRMPGFEPLWGTFQHGEPPAEWRRLGPTGNYYRQGASVPPPTFGHNATVPLGTSGHPSEFEEPQGRAPKGYTRSDARIHEDVCESLIRARLDAGEMEVSVERGEVRLEGFAPSRWVKHAAECIAADVPGVTEVLNHLRLGRAPTPTGETGEPGDGK